MKASISVFICSGIASTFALSERDEFDPANYASDDIITRDVAVIGGGVTGTYGAINLQIAGKSVVLIEKEGVLGGHTNTYIDPVTNISVDYGVQAFWNISVTRDFFDYLNVPYTAVSFPQATTVYADFQTGQQVALQPSKNYTGYSEQLAKYPYLAYSWKLPSPVPSDLLLPFKDFVTKYDLQDIAYSVYSDGEGFAHFQDQLTVNVFKMVDNSFLGGQVPGGAVFPASHDNSEIYTKALSVLGSDVLLNSTVKSAQRPSSNGSASGNSAFGVSLTVQTPSGKKLIQASKLLVTIPPLLHNMAPFDLDSTESGLFSQWNYTAYYTMVVNNTGLPAGFAFRNANSSASTFNMPALPAPYQVTPTRDPGIFYIWYGSPYALPRAAVEADVAAVVQRLQKTANSTVAAVGAAPNFLAFNSHTPFKLVVSADAISAGFYNRLEGLQGHRDTWYTGAAFMSHDGPVLWNFTQNVVLPDLLAAP